MAFTRVVLALTAALGIGLQSEASPIHQSVHIGKAQSRGIWTASKITNRAALAPAVILVTGTGPHGPNEMMPGKVTGDGKDHGLFDEFAQPLNDAGVATLQLGKPGVEVFSAWDATKWFYDKNLYLGLKWQDLLDNLVEAVAFVRSQPGVDPNRIYILGHSEGTQVAADYAKQDATIKGIILLGYAGQAIGQLANWQSFHEPIEYWIAPDVDANHDGFVSRQEASLWPEFKWPWATGRDKVSLTEIQLSLQHDPSTIEELSRLENTPLYGAGIWNREPMFNQVASLKQDVYIFTGQLDQNCPVIDSIKQGLVCKQFHKSNCSVTVVPGLGHGFSPPRAPRAQPLIDGTLGPVDRSFQDDLFQLGRHL